MGATEDFIQKAKMEAMNGGPSLVLSTVRVLQNRAISAGDTSLLPNVNAVAEEMGLGRSHVGEMLRGLLKKKAVERIKIGGINRYVVHSND